MPGGDLIPDPPITGEIIEKPKIAFEAVVHGESVDYSYAIKPAFVTFFMTQVFLTLRMLIKGIFYGK